MYSTERRLGVQKNEDIEALSEEMIFEICAVEIPKFDMLIINLYWPNSNREIEVFCNCLEKLLNKLSINFLKKASYLVAILT